MLKRFGKKRATCVKEKHAKEGEESQGVQLGPMPRRGSLRTILNWTLRYHLRHLGQAYTFAPLPQYDAFVVDSPARP